MLTATSSLLSQMCRLAALLLKKKSFVQRRVTAIRIFFFFVLSHVICRCEILAETELTTVYYHFILKQEV